MSVVTRIAPSPTGNLHIGTARTALFNYLFARQADGRFVLRVEDTDKARSTAEFEENILSGLAWLGLEWDDFARQSERTDLYVGHLERLIAADKAYVSKEPAKDNPAEEVEVVRLRNPNTVIVFNDLIRGEISFDTTELGNFVIARSVRDPLYHFAVVVDDAEMGVTHVIRGEDHISNTPRQILILEALGFTRPLYAHIPLILAPDRSKMSKRKGAVSISEYQAQGFLPEALVNYLALLGWSPGTDQEIFTLEELVRAFSIDHIHKGGAIFDIEKLKWINREHIRRLPLEEFKERLRPFVEGRGAGTEVLLSNDIALKDLHERIATLGEVAIKAGENEFAYYKEAPEVAKEALVWKKDPDPENAVRHLTHVRNQLSDIDESSFTPETCKEKIWLYADSEGRGNVLWPLRYALSGRNESPDPFTLCGILGKKETLSRIETAIGALSN